MASEVTEERKKLRQQQSQDGVKAMAEYHDERVQMAKRTEKLRAMRLAKEAEEAANAAPPAPKKKSAKKA
ncbi:transcriptional regulator [Flaviflagellibacter deserti]|uniref:Transcriptional regulator n=1 Tax=Flaviflagellibacter deserti TaxID=2267266 RepID=A0ABV9Z012_9HYPH